MYRSGAVERGRESFRHRSWAEAFARLAAAEDALDPSDLERLATAAFLIGRDAESDEAWARAHREWSRRREPERAARCAFWLAFGLLDRGEQARSSGWVGRARRARESG